VPGTTVPLGYPYPLPGDPLNVNDIQELAEAIDVSVQATEDSLAEAEAPPTVRATGTAQVIANSTTTLLTFNAAPYDNAGFTDFVGSPQALIMPTPNPGPARYLYLAEVTWASNATGFRRVEITSNGTVFSRAEEPAAATPFVTSQRAQYAFSAAAGTLIRVQVTQNSGGNLSVLSCALSIVRFDK
jgi:hypothetical protein